MQDITDTNWWRYCDEPLQELLKESFDLIEQESMRGEEREYKDYSFIVFPAAKAYEGFLKKLFLDMGLISQNQYYGEHFRIGRALSPMLPKRYRAGWVYGKLMDYCRGQELPMRMWEVWEKGEK